MLVHVNNHDSSLALEKERGGSLLQTQGHILSDVLPNTGSRLLNCIEHRAEWGLLLADAGSSLTGKINTEQLRSLKGFDMLFKQYWSRICCVIDVQNKRQQL